MSPSVTLRAGYNHSDNPVTGANITPNILAPGVITSHYTLGATYAMSPTSELTWAFMYAPRVSVSGPSMLAGTETVSMRQTAIGLQWGMKF
jgi:long-chain fatty acid transport protein